MANKQFLQARPFVALSIVLAVWALLPLVVKSLARVSFYEFQAPAQVSASYLRDLQEFWGGARLHSNTELFEVGRDLSRLNASYELSIRENESLHVEVARLERLLNLPARDSFRTEVARVVRRDFSAWWQQITIRKGQNYGIRKGDPVVFVGGVVGRVREVHSYTAIIDLLSSQNVRVAANFEGDNRPVGYQGGPNPAFSGPEGTVEFVPLDIATSEEDPRLLVTAGMGGVFPPGLPIGRVTGLRTSSDGQFQIGTIKLDDRLSALTEVAVLIADERE